MMSTKLKHIKVPEIRFTYGWLLTDAFMTYRKEIKRFKDSKAPTWNQMKKVISNREKLWKKDERRIIMGMQKIAGLNFYQDLIDVYIVYGWRAAFSNPLVISMKYRGENFVDVLTHEILHRLLTDNLQDKNGGAWPMNEYPEEKKNPTVIYHILVHAIHKEIYLKVLKRPDRLKKDIKNCQKWPAYKRAWEIVERDGHMNIINKFKASKARN